MHQIGTKTKKLHAQFYPLKKWKKIRKNCLKCCKKIGYPIYADIPIIVAGEEGHI